MTDVEPVTVICSTCCRYVTFDDSARGGRHRCPRCAGWCNVPTLEPGPEQRRREQAALSRDQHP